jgi:hypothetical protein
MRPGIRMQRVCTGTPVDCEHIVRELVARPGRREEGGGRREEGGGRREERGGRRMRQVHGFAHT